MNKTLIPWADYTWNPIVGCRNACGVTADNPKGWCYARRLATTRLAHLCEKCGTFEPHLHEERLDQPLHMKKPAVIFADSMSDWWSEGVEDEWLGRVLAVMADCPRHRFIVLTKRPERITVMAMRFWPSNVWLGVSITSGDDWWRWEALAKLPKHIHKFVSVEPLLRSGIGPALSEEGRREHPLPEWVIVGPLSGPGEKPGVALWQDTIRDACEASRIPLFEKPHLPLQPPVRQMPLDLASVFRKGGLTL